MTGHGYIHQRRPRGLRVGQRHGFREPESAPSSPSRPGRPRVRPRRRLAPGLVYATVRKERKEGRVVSIRRSIVLGDEPTVEALLKASV